MEYCAAVNKGRAVQIDSKDTCDIQGTEQDLLTDIYVNNTHTQRKLAEPSGRTDFITVTGDDWADVWGGGTR